MRSCNTDAGTRNLAGDARRTFYERVLGWTLSTNASTAQRRSNGAKRTNDVVQRGGKYA
ncbi:PsiF family protein [Roseomonas haemaphysalidis]|nr:PsiF family protein [Roseomonas haemaphysalidis]